MRSISRLSDKRRRVHTFAPLVYASNAGWAPPWQAAVMSIRMQIWRADDGLQQLTQTGTPNEKQLEELLETDPSLLGQPLLVIGRQVRTDLGRIVDLLALDSEGVLHVLELKKEKAPRDVVAQALEYAAWARTLDQDQVRQIHDQYMPDTELEVRATELFGFTPDEVGVQHQITIVASEVDPHVHRVIEYLQVAGVPVNAALFSYFGDDERSYLARAWLVEPTEQAGAQREVSAGRKEPWNGKDWYVSYGSESGIRDWTDATNYGFISAGGGDWYSRTLNSLPVGGRVFACIPKLGYVGVGKVVGVATTADQATLMHNGVETKFRDLPLVAGYTHANGEPEFVVPIEWIKTVPMDAAIWERGMFANQNSACKLRSRFTLDRLVPAFGLEE